MFLGIKKRNPPQIAVWLEDAEGRYLGTLYASKKIATQSWVSASGNRRKEALPYWCHQCGVVYDDGLYLPTKDQPLVDGMTGATPRADFDILLKEKTGVRHFYVIVEVNHSTDFNDRYSEDKMEGETRLATVRKLKKVEIICTFTHFFVPLHPHFTKEYFF